jgi:hypothetical protein
MRKTFDGFEGDTTLIYDDSGVKTITIKLIGQFGYKREVDIKEDDSYLLKYVNPFSNEDIEKEVKENKTKYTYNKLKSENFKPTREKLYDVISVLFENGNIETIND